MPVPWHDEPDDAAWQLRRAPEGRRFSGFPLDPIPGRVQRQHLQNDRLGDGGGDRRRPGAGQPLPGARRRGLCAAVPAFCGARRTARRPLQQNARSPNHEGVRDAGDVVRHRGPGFASHRFVAGCAVPVGHAGELLQPGQVRHPAGDHQRGATGAGQRTARADDLRRHRSGQRRRSFDVRAMEERAGQVGTCAGGHRGHRVARQPEDHARPGIRIPPNPFTGTRFARSGPARFTCARTGRCG